MQASFFPATMSMTDIYMDGHKEQECPLMQSMIHNNVHLQSLQFHERVKNETCLSLIIFASSYHYDHLSQ